MTSNVLQTIGASTVEKDDTLIGVLPLYHIYGMTVLMCYALAKQVRDLPTSAHICPHLPTSAHVCPCLPSMTFDDSPQVLCPLAKQSELVLLHKFEPESFLSAMATFRVSVAFLVPPILVFLTKHPMVREYDLTAVRAIMSGAAPLDAATQESLSRELGAPVTQGWGMTELAPIGAIGMWDHPVRSARTQSPS